MGVGDDCYAYMRDEHKEHCFLTSMSISSGVYIQRFCAELADAQVCLSPIKMTALAYPRILIIPTSGCYIRHLPNGIMACTYHLIRKLGYFCFGSRYTMLVSIEA